MRGIAARQAAGTAGGHLSAVALAGLFLLIAILVGFGGLLVGAKPMRLDTALYAIFAPAANIDSTIVWTLRLPRSIAAFLAGGGLGLSGYLLQSFSRNPLASPDLTGVTAGAVASIVGCFVFLPWLSSIYYAPIGLVGGLGAAATTFWIARGGRTSPLHLALGGVTVALFLGGLTTYMLLLGGPQSPAVLFWLSGGLQGRSWSHIVFMLPWIGASLIGALLGHRIVALLSLSDQAAAGMGLNLALWKPVLLVLATLPVAGITPVAGPIAFIGLAVPHIVRLLRPSGPATAIMLNVAAGGMLLVAADVLARSLAAPREIPVGIITALIGGPYFVYLTQRPNFGAGRER
ncbi:FecCD family ABC transporter permease [Labrys portucalensis]|uniref:FecCD family ABC transporter permease n=1 Tax=Labrys neptuniae TaxID=376174 RepID=A0ABV6ZLF9_9HYPH